MKISDSFSSFKTLPGYRTLNVDVYLKSLDISKQRSTILSITELLFELNQTAGYLAKLLHTNAFTSTRYNAKWKGSLTQQNACARLNLRVKKARLMFV